MLENTFEDIVMCHQGILFCTEYPCRTRTRLWYGMDISHRRHVACRIY